MRMRTFPQGDFRSGRDLYHWVGLKTLITLHCLVWINLNKLKSYDSKKTSFRLRIREFSSQLLVPTNYLNANLIMFLNLLFKLYQLQMVQDSLKLVKPFKSTGTKIYMWHTNLFWLGLSDWVSWKIKFAMRMPKTTSEQAHCTEKMIDCINRSGAYFCHSLFAQNMFKNIAQLCICVDIYNL
jgi:hypothetical protein